MRLAVTVVSVALASALAGVLVSGPASAEQKPDAKIVLELFTSQGCSSCPPADALLKSYTGRDDIIALTMPVDYWDYLGWKDTFASPRNAERQRNYARHRGDGAVYTPQVVVNGLQHAIGSNPRKIDSAMKSVMDAGGLMRVPVSFKVKGGAISIEMGEAAVSLGPDGATVWLGIVQKSATVPVRSGENGGKSLSYFNIVRQMSAVGMWEGKAGVIHLAKNSVMSGDTDACVVLIQQGTDGPIIGAAWWEAPMKKANLN